MLTKLIDFLKENSVKRGSFVLASGLESNYYIDCRLSILTTRGSKLIGDAFVDELYGSGAHVIAGFGVGSAPLVGAILARSDLPLKGLIIRDQVKEHGTKKLIEGDLKSGDNVIIVDDVATTGKSLLKTKEIIEAARGEGAVIGSLVLCDRLQGAKDHVPNFRSILTIKDLGL